MAQLQITYRGIGDLRPRATNPRTHAKKQLEQIAASIRRFGFTNPILIDEADGIIAGHGRVEAAKLIGMTEVPTVRLADMSGAKIRAYVIADNRLAELAGWDRTLLELDTRINSRHLALWGCAVGSGGFCSIFWGSDQADWSGFCLNA